MPRTICLEFSFLSHSYTFFDQVLEEKLNTHNKLVKSLNRLIRKGYSHDIVVKRIKIAYSVLTFIRSQALYIETNTPYFSKQFQYGTGCVLIM